MKSLAKRPKKFCVSACRRYSYTSIDSQLAGATKGATVSRNGNPLWRWTPFPRDIEYLNPTHNYLRVSQKLNVALDDPLPDYKASFTYYLRLVASNGVVTGKVQRWEYWVESGLLTEFVGAVLKPYVKLGAEKLNDLLASGGA